MKYIIIIAILIATATQAQTTFSGTLTIYPDWTHAKVSGASTVTESFANFLEWTHTSGAGTNQMAAFYRQVGTLTNGQDRAFNLAGGITNSFGDTLTLSRVNFMAFAAGADNTDAIQIGSAGVDESFGAWLSGTNDYVSIEPGGFMLLTAPRSEGYTSTNGVSNLRIINTGTNDAAYELYIGGAE